MNLKKALAEESISLTLKGQTKEEILNELTDLLVASGKAANRDDICEAMVDREKKMSTGMQNGIAIPHGKTDAVNTLVAAVGIHKEGADFGALDGKPCHFFIATVSPNTRTGPHIQFLAEVSRSLNDASIRENMLTATSAQAILDMLNK